MKTETTASLDDLKRRAIDAYADLVAARERSEEAAREEQRLANRVQLRALARRTLDLEIPDEAFADDGGFATLGDLRMQAVGSRGTVLSVSRLCSRGLHAVSGQHVSGLAALGALLAGELPPCGWCSFDDSSDEAPA